MKVKEGLKIFIVAALGMFMLVTLLGHITIDIGAFEVRLSISFFDHGLTQLAIPPLGRVRAPTHVPPLMLSALLTNINLDLLRQHVPLLQQEDYVVGLVDEVRRTLLTYIVRLLLLGFMGGAGAVYFLLTRKRKEVLLGGLIGLIILSILLFSLYISYDLNAFIHPEFEGTLAAAPWAFGMLEEALVQVATLGEQLELIASNLYFLFERLEFLEPLGFLDGQKKILHVSDIHNNPAAYSFVEQVVRSFNVDFIIDTGDLSDFGTPLEAELGIRVGALGVPYIFIPGNHDSPDISAGLADLPGVYVLEKGVVEVEEVVVAGIKDPSSVSGEMVVASQVDLDSYAEDLRVEIEASGMEPDIVAAHHPRIVSAFIGEVPLLLTGHTHTMEVDRIEDSVFINAGTTGAAGIRGLQTAREVPFSVVLIHMNKDTEGENRWQPIAADTIKVFQLQSGFTLSRILLIDTFLEGLEEDELELE